MKYELIKMLAEYLHISNEEAESRFNNSNINTILNDETANLRYQTIEYVFNLLKQEIAEEDEDDFEDDFERPESMPEGSFVRSH